MVKAWKDKPGGKFPSNIPPLIDIATWNKVQQKFKRQNKKGISQRDAIPLRGALHCHCGKLLTGAPSINKLGNPYYYYKCSTSSQHNNISAIKAHDQLQQALHYMSLPVYMIEAIKAESNKEMDLQLKNNKKELMKTRTELLQCEEDLQSVEDNG